MVLELTTSSLGIKITDPLFSIPTKALKKNACAALHTVQAVPDLRLLAGRLRDGFRPLGLRTEDRTIKRSSARANARRWLRRP